MTIDSETARKQLARIERGETRFSAGPARVILVDVEQESTEPGALSLSKAYTVWQQAYKQFVWVEKEIGASAEVIAAAIYALLIAEELDTGQHVCGEGLNGSIYKVVLEKTGEEFYLPLCKTSGVSGWKDPTINSFSCMSKT